MGAFWLKDSLQAKAIVSKAYCKDDRLCEVVLSGSNQQIPKTLRVYIPLSSDADENYLINQEVVSRAIRRNATHIVYEKWIIGVTLAGDEYAKENNISIMKVGEFLSKIDRGVSP